MIRNCSTHFLVNDHASKNKLFVFVVFCYDYELPRAPTILYLWRPFHHEAYASCSGSYGHCDGSIRAEAIAKENKPSKNTNLVKEKKGKIKKKMEGKGSAALVMT
jgi:hypothetical protein